MMHSWIIEWYNPNRGFAQQLVCASCPSEAFRIAVLTDLHGQPIAAANINDFLDITTAGYILHSIKQLDVCYANANN